ncbi:hypothetical protein HYW17_01055 [Candidatus Uhrbacteria bacterium]|nr:hypothetical protein [Candidatus Uhrbacteria bacterium]
MRLLRPGGKKPFLLWIELRKPRGNPTHDREKACNHNEEQNPNQHGIYHDRLLSCSYIKEHVRIITHQVVRVKHLYLKKKSAQHIHAGRERARSPQLARVD